MRRIATIILLTSSLYTAHSQSITNENREPSRSTFMSHRTAYGYNLAPMNVSENFMSLAGEWRVQDLSTCLAKTISLPAANEANSLGKSIYSHGAYTFMSSQPVDSFSPPTSSDTISYSRKFTVPFDFTDRMLYLCIGAASSEVQVFINNKYVGMSTDSRSPAEFAISDFVQRGTNEVELRVSRYTASSLLEDQTGWRLTGINREVYLFAQPKIRVLDYIVQNRLDPDYDTGLLETALIVKTELLNTHTVKVYFDLFDPKGELIRQDSREVTTSMKSVDTVRFATTILDVEKWNHETPNLYTIQYRIQREGRFTENVAFKTGFRNVEIRNSKMLLNGRAIIIKGVNYGEYSPLTGNVLPRGEMLKTINDFKLRGLNAIRTDGYPMPSDFYYICDSIGIYVCDVANINAQGLGTSRSKGRSIANDPTWIEHFKYRVNNMYERNKNHTSVIMWALGDNAGNGYNMYEAYLMLKAKDASRPVVYNGAELEFNSDIHCPDYPSKDLITGLDGKPIIDPTSVQIEGLDGQPIIFSRCKFDTRIWTSSDSQGGFIDYVTSPSLQFDGTFATIDDKYQITPLANGEIEIEEAQANLDGITSLFTPLTIEKIDAKKNIYQITNNLDFTDLNHYKISCAIEGKDKKAPKQLKTLNAKPGESVLVTLPKGYDILTVEGIVSFYLTPRMQMATER